MDKERTRGELLPNREKLETGKVLVIKVGGSEGINLEAVCKDVAELYRFGLPVVLVHGGSAETNKVAERLGHPPAFVTSVSGHVSRYTNKETLAIFEMVYCGRINKEIVERLQKLGVNAIGLSGLDGRLAEGERKTTLKIIEGGKRRVLRDDYTGTVKKVNAGLLKLFISNGYLPVVTPPAVSFAGEAINVDGDRMAAAIAASLNAGSLIILSNVPGFLEKYPDEGTLIQNLTLSQAVVLSERPHLGRVRSKFLAAVEALNKGVKRVVFADGRIANPVTSALLGRGTVIEQGNQ